MSKTFEETKTWLLKNINEHKWEIELRLIFADNIKEDIYFLLNNEERMREEKTGMR